MGVLSKIYISKLWFSFSLTITIAIIISENRVIFGIMTLKDYFRPILGSLLFTNRTKILEFFRLIFLTMNCILIKF